MAARNVDQQLTEVASLRMERDVLLQRAFLLEYATLAWMTIEAAIAIGSGLVAHSLVLVAFGIDSVIELASATVLLWRLKVELRPASYSRRMRRRPPPAREVPCSSCSPPTSLRLQVGSSGHGRVPSSRC
jgi:hypothetical protein